ncbi:MAG: ABC transporter substrate-binding protein [Clostridiales bacterium]|nr:ABC transporter substrate-binding protein [Clostridiales bacterium]
MKINNTAIKRILTFVMVLILALATSGCKTYDNFIESNNPKPDDVIRIGIFEPLSGSDKKGGELEIKGIKLAHELYPTVLGKKVELVYVDNKSELDIAQKAAQELVDKQVDIVLGSYGNALSLAGGEIFEAAKIPAINITGTNPLITKGNPYYFRICIVDSFQGVMAAKYVYNYLETDKVVIMKAYNDDYGSALAQQFMEKFISLTESDDSIVATVEYISGSKDFTRQLERIRSSDAKVVFLPGALEDSIEIVKQARSRGMNNIFLGTDLWYQDALIEEGGEAVENMIFTTYFDADSTVTETTKEFLEVYRNKYGDEEPHSAVALGFDAYLLAIDAIKRHAESQNYKTLKQVLQETREFQGATGSITFDENGDPIKTVVFMAVENGEFVSKGTEEPSWE